jgi:hypothetical protein
VLPGDPPPDPRSLASLGVLTLVKLHHCLVLAVIRSEGSAPGDLGGCPPGKGLDPTRPTEQSEKTIKIQHQDYEITWNS